MNLFSVIRRFPFSSFLLLISISIGRQALLRGSSTAAFGSGGSMVETLGGVRKGSLLFTATDSSNEGRLRLERLRPDFPEINGEVTTGTVSRRLVWFGVSVRRLCSDRTTARRLTNCIRWQRLWDWVTMVLRFPVVGDRRGFWLFDSGRGFGQNGGDGWMRLREEIFNL